MHIGGLSQRLAFFGAFLITALHETADSEADVVYLRMDADRNVFIPFFIWVWVPGIFRIFVKDLLLQQIRHI